jgi:hypothetical protein
VVLGAHICERVLDALHLRPAAACQEVRTTCIIYMISRMHTPIQMNLIFSAVACLKRAHFLRNIDVYNRAPSLKKSF